MEGHVRLVLSQRFWILYPGLQSYSDLVLLLRDISKVVIGFPSMDGEGVDKPRSPGMKYKHYALIQK